MNMQKNTIPNPIDFSGGLPDDLKGLGDDFYLHNYGDKTAIHEGWSPALGGTPTSRWFKNVCRAKNQLWNYAGMEGPYYWARDLVITSAPFSAP